MQQHFNTIKKRFAGFPVKFDMLCEFPHPQGAEGDRPQAQGGRAGSLVVGTHRLLNKDVQYKDLGLLIVDEEQRAGVNHKNPSST